MKAQSYQLTVSSEPFAYLENAENAVDGPWDVPEFQLPIGFDFELFDLTSDTIYSYFNSFGGIFEINLDEDHLYMLIPFLASLIDRGYQQDSALSPIKYLTEGALGHQVFTLEFKEAGLFEGEETDDGVFLDYVSFQIRLYEDSGNIEFHYGPYSTQKDPIVIFDPFHGPLVGLLADADWNTPGGQLGEIIVLEGSPLKPTVATDTFPTFLDGPIPENTVYRFSRISTSVSDHLRFTNQPMFFPNPAFGDINLHVNNANEITYPITVMDALGRRVMMWNTESEISTAGLSAGCFYILVNTKSKVITEKLIVLSE